MYILCLLYKIHISAKIEYNPDCKVCFVRREYSVVALFMRGAAYVGMQSMESTLVLPNPISGS